MAKGGATVSLIDSVINVHYAQTGGGRPLHECSHSKQIGGFISISCSLMGVSASGGRIQSSTLFTVDSPFICIKIHRKDFLTAEGE